MSDTCAFFAETLALTTTTFLSSRVYIFLFGLLGIVYIAGLFVPLIDNDSAHHAAIALRMHLTGDYVTLVDWGGDYLDKPHLLFWLAAFSYKIFGVNAFAYKLPSLLFTILGTYSTYRLGRKLYDNETGKLAALIIASAFAYIIANSDVRMDAILTASIAFATWQLIEFADQKRIINVIGSALGLALGFCTKGHIAVLVPGMACLFFIFYKKDWKIFINWKWLLMLVAFGVFISPVVYAYYQQFNLHPEKVIRGRDHINGVKFILLNQSIERFSGGMGGDSKNDYLFFIHSFLWAFAPWSILAFIAVGNRIKHFLKRKEEWATTATFITVLVGVSLSSFKLPHYLNVVFPVAAVMTAALLFNIRAMPKWIKPVFTLQLISSLLLLVVASVLNAWAFPIRYFWIILSVILLLAVVFYFIKSSMYNLLQKAVTIPVAAVVLVFFLMNVNFYPQLLTYQAGQNLAAITKGKVDPEDVYVQPKGYSYSSSYTFYAKSQFHTFDDSLIGKKNKIWMVAEPSNIDTMMARYQTGEIYRVPHFRVTKLNLKFLNPSTRDKELSEMMLVEILGKKE